LPDTGGPVARGDRRALPQQRVDQDEQPDAGRAAAVQEPARAADLGIHAAGAAGAGRRPRTVRVSTGPANGGPAMSVNPAHLDHARKVADAILYEGYLLYPYRKSAQK